MSRALVGVGSRFPTVLMLLGLIQLGAARVQASTIGDFADDPLHGFCWGSSSCSDNGTNTPTSNNPPQFGFTISPGPQTGNFLVDVLVPNNLVAIPGSLSYSITGTQGGSLNDQAISVTASLFSATAWVAGGLADYLGLPLGSGAPPNPIDAYLPATQALDPLATGFYVYQAMLGTNQLRKNPDYSNGPLLEIGSLFQGSYLTGFLGVPVETCTTGRPPHICTISIKYISTAQSGAIFETSRPPEPNPGPGPGVVPLPPAGLLMGSAIAVLYGVGHRVRRRRLAPSFELSPISSPRRRLRTSCSTRRGEDHQDRFDGPIEWSNWKCRRRPG